jgi:hypothetical protein
MSIFRLAKAFDEHGFAPHFLKAGSGGVTLKQIASLGLDYSSVQLDSFSSPGELHSKPLAFGAFATFWTTAYQVASMPNAVNRGYLIQDWEPGFYPAGSLSAMAKGTYRLDLTHVVNTRSLASIIDSYSGEPSFSFDPSVDRNLFHFETPRVQRPKEVVAYWRPSHGRNCSEIVYETIKRVHTIDPDVVFNLVGEEKSLPESNLSRSSRVRLLGVLSPEETAALYSTCRAGIALMDTPHPSYLPFELMASGAIPVSTYNPATAWFLQDNQNSLVSEAGPRLLAEKVLLAMQDLPHIDAGMSQTIDSLAHWHITLSEVATGVLRSWKNSGASES